MTTITVRIGETAHRKLRALADSERTTMRVVIERALEDYRRQRFLETANRQYSNLRHDDQAWRHELAERELWIHSGTDGLNDE